MDEAFKAYLIERGYRLKTPSGAPSTALDYVGRVRSVCQWEDCSWEELAARIDAALMDYGPGGPKEALGEKSHRAVINALRRFKEFCQWYEKSSI